MSRKGLENPDASQAGPVQGSVTSHKPKIALLGDSITAHGTYPGGWSQLLAAQYTRKADIVNRGFGGYNSRWISLVIDRIMEEFKPGQVKLVTVCLGANDAAIPGRKQGNLSVPVEEYGTNFRAIVSALRLKYGIDAIIMMSPPPIDETKWQDVSRTVANLKEYVNTSSAVSQELGLPFVYLFEVFWAQKGWASLLMKPDGLHISPEGNSVIAGVALTAIKQRYPALSPDALPHHLPA